MKKTILTGLTVALALSASPRAEAYDEDVHYHLNYYLARVVGFDEATSDLIAATAQNTDVNELTFPTKATTAQGSEQRRRFHFPKHDGGGSPDTERNSVHGRFNMSKAIADGANPALRAQSLYSFGIALHVLEDSYSHESFGFREGHATALHNPDKPFLVGSAPGLTGKADYDNVSKTVETARLVFTRLKDYRKAITGNDAPPLKTAAEIDAFLLGDGTTPGVVRFNPGGCDLCDPADLTDTYNQEIAARCKNMALAIQTQGYGLTAYKADDYAKAHGADFETAAKRHLIPHVDFAYAYTAPTTFSLFRSLGPAMGAPAPQARPLQRSEGCGWAARQAPDSRSLADLVLDSAPWLAKSPCVRSRLGNEAALEQLLDRLEAGADAGSVISVLDASPASSRTTSRLLARRLPKLTGTPRLAVANRLYLTGSATAKDDLLAAARSASDETTQEALLDWTPRTSDFVPVYLDLLAKGSPSIQAQAAEAIQWTGAPAGVSTLRAYAQSLAFDGTEPPGIAYPAILSFRRHTWESVNPDAQRFLVRTLRLGLKGRPQLVKAAATALRTQYSGEREVARALVEALDVKDLAVRWSVGYALEVISNRRFDLTERGLAGIKAEAKDWYQQQFREAL